MGLMVIVIQVYGSMQARSGTERVRQMAICCTKLHNRLPGKCCIATHFDQYDYGEWKMKSKK